MNLIFLLTVVLLGGTPDSLDSPDRHLSDI